MSRDQTVFSELAVACGINNGTLEGIKGLDQDAVQKYKREQANRRNSSNALLKNSEKKLNEAGQKIRTWLIKNERINNVKLEWSANSAPETGDTVAQDLIIVNTSTRVSVKENAELFQNPSPVQVFEFWPKGQPFTRARSEDWFIAVAQQELNAYFNACNGKQITGQATAYDYYKNVKGNITINGKEVKKRKKFTQHVAGLHEQNITAVLDAYQKFCDSVGKESAKIFNQNFRNNFSKKTNGFYDIDELTNLISVFFKLDSHRHILAGTEENNPFAVAVMDINTWKKQFSVVNIAASHRKAGQPEVIIEFSFKNNLTGHDYVYKIQSQIRWSHGKFCGNPESKLYRFGGWKYSELPWVEVL